MSDTDYPAVRRVMGEHRLHLDDDALESVLEELFPDSDPAHVESFMGSWQRFGKEVAPIAQRALPGAVQGAMTGASVGGPYGALAGLAIGATTGALTAPQGPAKPVAPATPTAPVPPPTTMPAPPPTTMPAPPPTTMPAPPPTTMPAPPPTTAATTPNPPMAAKAAEALLAIITNEATINALQAYLLQTLGRSTVTVGDKQVPPAAFANAIAEFAAIAAENAMATEATTDYLYGDSGWPRGDLASPLERAEILLSDLREAARDAEPISAYERVAYGWQTDD
jgi:outer membrane biosynthesis protein TonB